MSNVPPGPPPQPPPDRSEPGRSAARPSSGALIAVTTAGLAGGGLELLQVSTGILVLFGPGAHPYLAVNLITMAVELAAAVGMIGGAVMLLRRSPWGRGTIAAGAGFTLLAAVIYFGLGFLERYLFGVTASSGWNLTPRMLAIILAAGSAVVVLATIFANAISAVPRRGTPLPDGPFPPSHPPPG